MKCYEFTFDTGNSLTAHGIDIPDMLLGLFQDDPYFEYEGILTGVVSLREGYTVVGEDESAIVSFTGDEVREISRLTYIGVSKMTVICAWCDKQMGTKDGPDIVTHGICQECLDKVLAEHKRDREQQEEVYCQPCLDEKADNTTREYLEVVETHPILE